MVLAIVVGVVAYFGVSSYLERALPSEQKMTRAEVLASATELDFDQYYGEYKSNKVLAGEKCNGNCYVTTATVNNIGVNGISNLLGLTELFKPGDQKEIQVVVEHVVGNTHVISIASKLPLQPDRVKYYPNLSKVYQQQTALISCHYWAKSRANRE